MILAGVFRELNNWNSVSGMFNRIIVTRLIYGRDMQE